MDFLCVQCLMDATVCVCTTYKHWLCILYMYDTYIFYYIYLHVVVVVAFTVCVYNMGIWAWANACEPIGALTLK